MSEPLMTLRQLHSAFGIDERRLSRILAKIPTRTGPDGRSAKAWPVRLAVLAIMHDQYHPGRDFCFECGQLLPELNIEED